MNNSIRSVLAGVFLWLTATGALAAFTSGGDLLGFWAGGNCGSVGISYLGSSSLSQTSPATVTAAPLGKPCATRVLAAAITLVDDDGAAVDITAVTIGGVSATERIAHGDTGSIDTKVEIWTAVVPKGTNGDVVVTWTGAVEDDPTAGLWRVISVDDADGVPTDSGSAANGVPITTVTIPTGGNGIFACVSVEEGNNITWTGATERYDIDGGTDGGGSGADVTTAGTPSVLCTNTVGLAEHYVGVAFGP